MEKKGTLADPALAVVMGELSGTQDYAVQLITRDVANNRVEVCRATRRSFIQNHRRRLMEPQLEGVGT